MHAAAHTVAVLMAACSRGLITVSILSFQDDRQENLNVKKERLILCVSVAVFEIIKSRTAIVTQRVNLCTLYDTLQESATGAVQCACMKCPAKWMDHDKLSVVLVLS